MLSLLGYGAKTLMPFVLSMLIDWFSDERTDTGYAYLVATIYGLLALFSSWIISPLMYMNMVDGHIFRCQLCALLFNKCLKLNSEGRKSISVGKIINIMSVDVSRCDKILIPFAKVLVSPIMLSVSLWQIHKRMSLAVYGAIGTTVLFLILNVVQAKIIGVYRALIAKRIDNRVRLLDEMIAAMQIIKMYVWEGFFLKKLMRFRKNEIQRHREKLYFYAFGDSILRSSSKYLVAIVISIYFSNSSLADFRTSDLFAVSMFLVIIEDNVRFLYTFATTYTELRHAFRRIEEILLLPEMKENEMGFANGINNKVFSESDGYGVKNVTANYPGSKDIALKDFSLTIPDGKLTGIIGLVGSGKSTFFSLLLKELQLKHGQMNGFSTFGYASQEPWIITGSIKDNILMGRRYDWIKYQKVIIAACLMPDLKLLEFGDETLVGDRGATLSGGQKARIGLARAIYSDAEVYLLDDPLAAVDSKVASKLYDNCINGYLKNKTRILITHQVKFLTNAANIAFIDEGRVLVEGDYQKIILHEHEFIQNLIIDDDTEPLTSTEKLQRKKSEKGESVQLANEEIKSEGNIGWTNFWNYIRASDTLYLFFLWVFMKLASVSLFVVADVQYSKIGNLAEEEKAACGTNCTGNIFDAPYIKKEYNTYVYLILSHGIALAFAYFANYTLLCNSGQNIHDMAVIGVIKAPIRFFNTNPAGRILNRFSKDMGQMDELLPIALEDATTLFIRALGIMVINAWANWFSVVIAIPTVASFILLRQYYLRTAREIKRLDGVMRSPMYNHVTNSIQGYLSIKAYGLQKKVYHHFNELQDIHGGAWLLFCATSRWLSVRLDTIIAFYILLISVIMIPLSRSETFKDLLNFTPASIGLSLSQASSMLGTIQHAVRQSSDAETYLTSVERIFEYAAIKPEPELAPQKCTEEDDEDSKKFVYNFDRRAIKETTQSIINRSEIEVKNYMEREIVAKDYYHRYSRDTNHVLKDLNFEIKLGEKIGIVGRTGAGKSSLISALFRMSNGDNGAISFDGVDLGSIELSYLRLSISIIPQEPIIFSESIRKNLDPTGKFTDDRIWDAIRKVQLATWVEEKNGKLDFVFSEQGANLSVGQKQLICLGRAILENNKLLLIDEATANVDPITDEFIQKTIKTVFHDCTVLTIAHRLNTIIDSDRIMVLDAGRICEFDSAVKLVEDGDSKFKAMIDESKDRAQLYRRIRNVGVKEIDTETML